MEDKLQRFYLFKDRGSENDVLEFNITSSVRRELSSQVTMNPVENQSDAADHVRNMPISISFKGILIEKDHINKKEIDDISYDTYLEKLDLWRMEKALLTIHYDDKLKRDRNLVITNFSMDKDSGILDGWRVSMSLKQVEISDRVELVKDFNLVSVDIKPKIQEKKVKTVTTKEKKTYEDILANSSYFNSGGG